MGDNLSYRRSSTYSYPPKFNKLEEVSDYAMRLYKELLENDSRGEEAGDKSTDRDLKALIVRPEWYGAKGDGVHDDTAAIQAAIDACPHVGNPLAHGVWNGGSYTSGIVFLSAKIYGITSLKLQTGTVLMGSGWKQTQLIRIGIGDGSPMISMAVGHGARVTLKSFQMDGGMLGVGLDGISLTDVVTEFSVNGTLQDLVVYRCSGYGVNLQVNVAEARNVFVFYCKVNWLIQGSSFYGYNLSAEGAQEEEMIIHCFGANIYGLQIEGSPWDTYNDPLRDVIKITGRGGVGLYGVWVNYESPGAMPVRHSIIYTDTYDFVLENFMNGGAVDTATFAVVDVGRGVEIPMPEKFSGIAHYSNNNPSQGSVFNDISILGMLSAANIEVTGNVNLPMISDGFVPCQATTPAELALNGGFNSDTSNWTPFDCSVASIGGGQSGNCLELTRTGGAYQFVFQTIASLTVGAIYTFSAYVKSGTSGDEGVSIMKRHTADNGDELYSPAMVSSDDWKKLSITFTATDTSYDFFLLKRTAIPGTMLFDTVSVALPGGLANSPLSTDGTNVDNSGVYKKGGVQVVGARVVDARLADTPNSGDATTDGLIDALRDLIIAHGLGASS